MSGDDARVAELVAEAQKKIKGGFLGFGGGKYDEAAELYTKAANIYKLAQRGEAAAELFLKAAECANKMNSRHDAANAYINAANCLRKAKPTEAGKLLEQAVTIFAEDGRFGMAAKQQRDLAELYEKEGDLPNAIEAYMKAARLYEGENSQSTANQCLLQAALHSAQLEKYDQAVQLYDQVYQN
jgi:alpha-soluble NSF attachment protein